MSAISKLVGRTVAVVIVAFTLVGQLSGQRVLSEEDFLALVAEHHPMAVSAALQRDRAEATLLMARGGFDPKLYADLDQKYFKGSRYYNLFDAGVKVPTWFGMELQATYERNDGSFLNPEATVPDAGLFAAGLSLPIGRGLMIDERRAALQQAQIGRALNEAERLALLNDLLLDAGKVYWEWAEAAAAVDVYAEALALAETRYEAVASGARLGDRPAIDTLEARIQAQQRSLSLESARLELDNTVAALSVYLWIDGTVPLELEPETRPLPLGVDLIDLIAVDSSNAPLTEHPVYLRDRLNIDQLEIDRRLAAEQLKPRLDVKYNALVSAGQSGFTETLSTNNYKWGLTFELPVPLRKARGKLQLARIKQSEAELKLRRKLAELEQKLAQSRNTVSTTARQYLLAEQNADNYRQLLAGERELFRAGESSLFLVNSRETSYVNATLKVIELLTKHRKALLELAYSRGVLPPD